ncbi:MAG: hypothetical protein KDD33_02745 [Bdellovibrionales bacterium]|nr:hypothetical protein [Bdellovibrionales bacterium]
MKRTITLGLMVFFVGLLMTACGSKKSSAPANTTPSNTTTDVSSDPSVLPFPTSTSVVANCTNSSGCTKTGAFTVSNQQLFVAAVETKLGAPIFSGSTNNNLFNNDLSINNGFLSNTLNTFAQCGATYLTAWAINSLFGGNSSGQCQSVTQTTTVNGVPTNGAIAVQASYADSALTLSGQNNITGHIRINATYMVSLNFVRASDGNYYDQNSSSVYLALKPNYSTQRFELYANIYGQTNSYQLVGSFF